jgi:hypothetical protein
MSPQLTPIQTSIDSHNGKPNTVAKLPANMPATTAPPMSAQPSPVDFPAPEFPSPRGPYPGNHIEGRE